MRRGRDGALERGYDAYGVDSNENTIAAGQRFLDQRAQDPARLRAQPLSALLSQAERYKTVISMDCLEHIADDRAALAELVRLVQPGGRLLITVPALPWVFGERDRILGHYRRYTRSSLQALLEGQPLVVRELRYWNALGVLPTFVNQRVFGKAIDESFRYGEPTLGRRALRAGLKQWFRRVENPITPPLGLTVFLAADRI
jgi:SAM-dependent methyltransferase